MFSFSSLGMTLDPSSAPINDLVRLKPSVFLIASTGAPLATWRQPWTGGRRLPQHFYIGQHNLGTSANSWEDITLTGNDKTVQKSRTLNLIIFYLVQLCFEFSLRVLLLGGEAVLIGVGICDILGISELGHRLATVHVGLEDGLQLEKLAAVGSWPMVQPTLVTSSRTRPPVTRVAHSRTLKMYNTI
jgi:hypothetical protein